MGSIPSKGRNFHIINGSRLNVGPPSLLFCVVLGSLSAERCEQYAEFPIYVNYSSGIRKLRFTPIPLISPYNTVIKHKDYFTII
jgi:hypothetical protein